MKVLLFSVRPPVERRQRTPSQLYIFSALSGLNQWVNMYSKPITPLWQCGLIPHNQCLQSEVIFAYNNQQMVSCVKQMTQFLDTVASLCHFIQVVGYFRLGYIWDKQSVVSDSFGKIMELIDVRFTWVVAGGAVSVVYSYRRVMLL